MPPARERAWPADARGDGKLMHSGGGRGLTVAFLRGPPGCWGANSRAHPRRCACGLRRRAQGRAHAPRVRRARPRPASGLARSRTRRAPARAARRSPSPPLPSPPRPRPGTLAGPERERRRHLSCCRCLQRSGALRREGARGGARGPASRRPRRRLLLGLRCSPRHEAAGLGLPGPRSPSRAPPCRSLCRPGPAAAPGARAMLRRPAPALAPAAWLLLAGLLCGGCGRVWAARVNKHKPWLEPTYHGIVTENDNTVLLDPPLIAMDKDAPLHFAAGLCPLNEQRFYRQKECTGAPLQRSGFYSHGSTKSVEVTVTKEGEICGFKIHGQNVPFEAVVVDKSTGEGVIRSTEKLDCELQKDYTFTIQAYDCGKGPDGTSVKKSHKATVHIQVNDVNEYAPVFKEKSYKATVVEGTSIAAF
uniref:Uncharacterized protein LOC109681898 n=1 Tax=Castor canadensis TaxID=51338 RepID=A0A8B7TY09_CASCN|nr:uncharacterized protein LOC109681898 [Castor canadensis]